MSKAISSVALLAVSSLLVPAAAMSATYEEAVLGDLNNGAPASILGPIYTAVIGSRTDSDPSDLFQMTLPTGVQTLSFAITSINQDYWIFSYQIDGGAGFSNLYSGSSDSSGTITLPSTFAGTFLANFDSEGGSFNYSLALVSADVPVPVPAALLVTGLAGLAAAGAKRKRAIRRG